MGFVLYRGLPLDVAQQLNNLRTCRCGGICSRCWPEIRRRIALLHGRADLDAQAIRRARLARLLTEPKKVL